MVDNAYSMLRELKEYAKENKNTDIYGRKCMPRFFIWDVVCTRTGTDVWTECQGNDRMDSGRSSVGFCAWSQQFFVWLFNRTNSIDFAKT